ncbi:hypothetical protein E4U19_007470 [Claviceps sp. Clav32 group G5]|nr:hypothetical protein E4U19_007470 [Claviceps sp. Clav32 group G5]
MTTFIGKKSALKEIFKSFIPALRRDFRHREWTLIAIENRYTYLKFTWRAFRAAESRSGTTYDEETGLLHMSDQTKEFIEDVHGRHGRAITTKPLLINDSITATQWAEIFASDTPAGDDVIAPDDDEGFEAAERRERREASSMNSFVWSLM